MSKLEAQVRRFKVFTTSDQADGLPNVTQLKSLTINDVATEEIATYLLTADGRRENVVLENVKEKSVEKYVPFLYRQIRQKSKTFASL